MQFSKGQFVSPGSFDFPQSDLEKWNLHRNCIGKVVRVGTKIEVDWNSGDPRRPQLDTMSPVSSC